MFEKYMRRCKARAPLVEDVRQIRVLRSNSVEIFSSNSNLSTGREFVSAMYNSPYLQMLPDRVSGSSPHTTL
jgi:hypothetical protein